jgi:hypothetical protein
MPRPPTRHSREGTPLCRGKSQGVGRELVRFAHYIVIPAKAGTQAAPQPAKGRSAGIPALPTSACPPLYCGLTWDRLGPRLRGDDEVGGEPLPLA